eukprot:Pgem_evm1s10194
MNFNLIILTTTVQVLLIFCILTNNTNAKPNPKIPNRKWVIVSRSDYSKLLKDKEKVLTDKKKFQEIVDEKAFFVADTEVSGSSRAFVNTYEFICPYGKEVTEILFNSISEDKNEYVQNVGIKCGSNGGVHDYVPYEAVTYDKNIKWNNGKGKRVHLHIFNCN